MNTKPINILLVEDNEGDILLICDAFDDAKIINNVEIARNGEQAMAMLHKTKGFESTVTPDLIILDVNLPRKNGHEVLKEIKESSDLRHIPVIMLTTSSSPGDINMSYKNHVNCYITKPVEVDDFLKVLLSIENFWISIVQLPDKPVSR